MNIISSKFILALLSIPLLSGCNLKLVSSIQPVLLIHIIDVSQSAKSADAFKASTQLICRSIIGASDSSDYYYRLLLDSRLTPYADPAPIIDEDSAYGDCNKTWTNHDKQDWGTFACPAWDRISKILSQEKQPYSSFTPYVVSQIQTNEEEFPLYDESSKMHCANILKNLAKMIESRHGKFVHVGSSNAGDSSFNDFINDTLRPSFGESVKIIGIDPNLETTIINDINMLHNLKKD